VSAADPRARLAERARAAAGAEVGLAVRATAHGDDTTVTVVIASLPEGFLSSTPMASSR